MFLLKYCIAVLILANISAPVQTLTVTIGTSDDTIYSSHDILLECYISSDDPTLVVGYVVWYYDTSNVISMYEFGSEVESPGVGYENRTIINGTNGVNATLILKDAAVMTDTGSYHCVLYPYSLHPITPSDPIDIGVFERAHIVNLTTTPDGCSVELTCTTSQGRPTPIIEWKYDNQTLNGSDVPYCAHQVDNYCAITSTLTIDHTVSGKIVDCIVELADPINDVDYMSTTIEVDEDCPVEQLLRLSCCLESWTCAVSIIILLLVECLLILGGKYADKQLEKRTYYSTTMLLLYIVITITILIAVAVSMAVPMHIENDSCSEEDCSANVCEKCDEWWLCPVITTSILVAVDICLGTMVYLRKKYEPQPQTENAFIKGGQDLTLTYRHTIVGITCLRLKKGNNILAEYDNSTTECKSDDTRVNCVKTPEGCQWLIREARADDAGCYTCVACACGTAIASKQITVLCEKETADL